MIFLSFLLARPVSDFSFSYMVLPFSLNFSYFESVTFVSVFIIRHIVVQSSSIFSPLVGVYIYSYCASLNFANADFFQVCYSDDHSVWINKNTSKFLFYIDDIVITFIISSDVCMQVNL